MNTVLGNKFKATLASLALLAICLGARAESVDITSLYSQPINLDNAVHPRYTPVQHYRGKTFIVVPDVNLRPLVTEIDDRTGKITTVPLDPNPDYKALADGHNRFTLGIDLDGYLHIAGDMHGYAEWATTYVERYQRQNMMYWRSNRPLDVLGGFTFAGGAHSMSRMPGIEWGGDSRFFNDKFGRMYFASRVRGFNNSRLSGMEPQIAYGMYSYDHDTGVWSAMGGPADTDEAGVTDRNTVLYWEWTFGFEAYQSNPRFDSHNRLHFSIGGNTAHTEGSGLIYAYSDDFGKTWKRANGTTIPGLPIRAKDGEADQGDLIARSKNVAQQSEVFIDKDEKIALNVAGQWETWDGKNWVKFNGGVGFLGPDGMLTGVDGSTLDRSAGIGQPVTSFDSGFGQCFSTSEIGLQDTGAIYAVGLPPGTNFTDGKVVTVFKARFGPEENIAKGGTPSASSSTSVGSEQPAQAFDNDRATKWNTDTSAPGWLEYALAPGTTKAVCRYELTSAPDVLHRDPKDWDFEGSTDGSNWVTLDSRKGQVFLARNQTKSYGVKDGTPYSYYRLNVTATNGGPTDGIALGEMKLWSVDASVVPSAPKIFFAQNDNGKVWLSWTEPDHAASYNVKRAAPGGKYTTIATGVIDPADFLDTTCVLGTPYYYVVSAVNSSGEGPNSAPVGVTSKLEPPRPPIIQTAVGRNRNIVLNWLPLWPQATSYNVKRSAKPGGPYTLLARGVPGLTYTDIGLTNDTPYYYVVSAANAVSGESANSREISGSPFRWINVLHYHSIGKDDAGTASASSENTQSGEVAAKAFDNVMNDKWLFPNSTAWLQYKFADGVSWALTRYQIVSCQDAPERDPADWQFQGSTDGTTWLTLDTQKNQTFAQRNATNTYSFENTTPYQYYRLNITRTNGGGLGALAELVLWADGPILKRPPPLTPFPSATPIAQMP